MENQIRGHGSLYQSYQDRNRQGKENRALKVLEETGYFNRQGNGGSGIVDIEGTVKKIEGGSGGTQEETPTYNADLQTQRNRESEKTRMLQQYGGNQLDPVGAGVLSSAAALALTDGKLLPTLAAGVGGFALARHFKNQGEKNSQGFDASQAVEGTQPINGGEIQPVPQLQRDEIVTPSEAVYKEKADISGVDPSQSSPDELAIAPGFVDAAANRSNTFGQDAITMLAQSFKTTGDETVGSNMQPQIGGEPGLELPAPGGSPGNVPNPADELVTSFSKGRVPSYLAQTLGGGFTS